MNRENLPNLSDAGEIHSLVIKDQRNLASPTLMDRIGSQEEAFSCIVRDEKIVATYSSSLRPDDTYPNVSSKTEEDNLELCLEDDLEQAERELILAIR